MLVTQKTQRLMHVTAALIIALTIGPRAVSASDRILQALPDTTVGYVHVPDFDRLKGQAMKTSWARLLKEPKWSDFASQVRESLRQPERSNNQRELGDFGWTARRLMPLHLGELTVAWLETDDQNLAWLAVLDPGADAEAVDEVLAEHLAITRKNGELQSEERKVRDAKLIVFTTKGRKPADDDSDDDFESLEFDPEEPAEDDDEDADFDDSMECYVQHDGLTLISNSPEALESVLAALDGAPGRRLTAQPHYRRCIQKSRAAGGVNRTASGSSNAPVVSWYLDPVAMAGAVVANPLVGFDRGSGLGIGLENIKALTGKAYLAGSDVDLLVRTELLLASPRTGLAQLVQLGSLSRQREPALPESTVHGLSLAWDVEASLASLEKLAGSRVGGFLVLQALSDDVGLHRAAMEEDVLDRVTGDFHFFWHRDANSNGNQDRAVFTARIRDAESFEPILVKALKQSKIRTRREEFRDAVMFRLDKAPKRVSRKASRRASSNAGWTCFGLVDDLVVLCEHPDSFRTLVKTRRGTTPTLNDSIEYKAMVSRGRNLMGGEVGMIQFIQLPHYVQALHAELEASGSDDATTDRHLLQDLLRGLSRSSAVPPFETMKPYLTPAGACLQDRGESIRYLLFVPRRSAASAEQ